MILSGRREKELERVKVACITQGRVASGRHCQLIEPLTLPLDLRSGTHPERSTRLLVARDRQPLGLDRCLLNCNNQRVTGIQRCQAVGPCHVELLRRRATSSGTDQGPKKEHGVSVTGPLTRLTHPLRDPR